VTARAILQQLADIGARLELDGEGLCVSTGSKGIPAALVAAIKAARPELIEILSKGETVSPAEVDTDDDGAEAVTLLHTREYLDRRLRALRLVGKLWADGIELKLVRSEIRVLGEISSKDERAVRDLAAEIAPYLVESSA
jgi:hypothetical protein